MRELVKLIEHQVRQRAALEFNHDSHGVFAIRLVAQHSDIGDAPLFIGRADRLDEVLFVDLIRNLGDDDDAAALVFLDPHLAAQANAALPSRVNLADALLAQAPAGRKVRPRHVLHQLIQFNVAVVNNRQ